MGLMEESQTWVDSKRCAYEVVLIVRTVHPPYLPKRGGRRSSEAEPREDMKSGTSAADSPQGCIRQGVDALQGRGVEIETA